MKSSLSEFISLEQCHIISPPSLRIAKWFARKSPTSTRLYPRNRILSPNPFHVPEQDATLVLIWRLSIFLGLVDWTGTSNNIYGVSKLTDLNIYLLGHAMPAIQRPMDCVTETCSFFFPPSLDILVLPFWIGFCQSYEEISLNLAGGNWKTEILKSFKWWSWWAYGLVS